MTQAITMYRKIYICCKCGRPLKPKLQKQGNSGYWKSFESTFKIICPVCKKMDIIVKWEGFKELPFPATKYK